MQFRFQASAVGMLSAAAMSETAAALEEVNDLLVPDASAASTDAKFTEVATTPGAVESVPAAGTIGRWGPISASLRVRHFGEAPLIEDGSVTSDGTTLVNLCGAYNRGRSEIRLDVLTLPDSDDRNISCFYESQLRRELTGFEDLHLHPVEPQQVRIIFRTRF